MSESKESTPYLSVDFGEQGGHHEWKTHEEAINWITQLQSQWSWISGLGHQATHNAWQIIAGNLNTVTTNLQQAQSYLNQNQLPHADQNIAAARSALEGLIRSYPWLLPNTAQRSFVDELRNGGKPLDAGLIVANWMGQDLNGTPIRHVVNALLQWELYERGIKDRMKTESATLKRLAGSMQTTLTEYQEAERAQTNRFDALHDKISEQQSAQEASFDKEQKRLIYEWESQRNSTQQELDNLKNTYDQHMAIAAPVDYWETKRKKHQQQTWIFGVAVFIGMIVVGLFLSSKMQSISDVLASPPTQQAATSAIQSTATLQTAATPASATWHLGSFIMLAVLCFWFVRLLVRIFLSNMHLENDAAERVTMAKTYLALIRSDSLSKEENINTVLAALFRPTGDGIVRDEGIPPSAVDFLTKLGK